MTWPFVSRARFEDERKKVEELEADRRRLLDRISLLRGEPPMYAERPAVAAAPTPVPAKRPTESEAPRRRITRKELLQQANEAARQRQRVPGSISVVAEMQQVEETARKRAMEMAVENAG